MIRSRWPSFSLLAAALIAVPAAFGAAQAPRRAPERLKVQVTPGAPKAAPAPPAPETGLARELTVEVRSAGLADLVERLGASVALPMSAAPEIGRERVTLYAGSATTASLQQALAALYHTEWSGGPGERAGMRLEDHDELLAAARGLRGRRNALFITRLLETQQALGRRTHESLAAAIRTGVARREPYLSRETLADITPEFIRQTLLLGPLRMGMGATLARNGNVWAPFQRLPAASQGLLAAFFLEQAAPEGEAEAVRTDSGGPSPFVLNYPQARLEYRLLYGDRWTGNVLLVRVGASDNWAEALLPSVLYDLPDYGSLYPEARVRPSDDALYKSTTLQINPETMSWDVALTTVARAAGIRVLSDSYPRPSVFASATPAPAITGLTFNELIERMAAYYGYVWWQEGDFFLFRSRMWAEEGRVAVPESVLQALGRDIGDDRRLAAHNFATLASLSDEQTLTLHLSGSAAGRPIVPTDHFDYGEIQLARYGLVMLAQMNDEQRTLARGEGIPVRLLPAPAQSIFAATAFDRGIDLDPDEADRWTLRVTEQFDRQRLQAGLAEVGTLQFRFDYGAAGDRRTTLALRAPALDPPKESGR